MSRKVSKYSYLLPKETVSQQHNELSIAIALFPVRPAEQESLKRLSDTGFFFRFLILDMGTATAALNLVNGYLFKGKPVIIQYGKQRKDSYDKNGKNTNTHGTSST